MRVQAQGQLEACPTLKSITKVTSPPLPEKTAMPHVGWPLQGHGLSLAGNQSLPLWPLSQQMFTGHLLGPALCSWHWGHRVKRTPGSLPLWSAHGGWGREETEENIVKSVFCHVVTSAMEDMVPARRARDPGNRLLF